MRVEGWSVAEARERLQPAIAEAAELGSWAAPVAKLVVLHICCSRVAVALQAGPGEGEGPEGTSEAGVPSPEGGGEREGEGRAHSSLQEGGGLDLSEATLVALLPSLVFVLVYLLFIGMLVLCMYVCIAYWNACALSWCAREAPSSNRALYS